MSKRAVTLLGMSGAGKTHFSQRMAEWGWTSYSNDFEIAQYLKIDVTVEDLSALSAFVGQVGDEAKGGLSLTEFKKRQKMYYDAECLVMDTGAVPAIDKYVNDSTGSFCEIESEPLIAKVALNTHLVYIEIAEDDHDEIIKRAVEYPKPLYFPPVLFDGWLDEYCQQQGVTVESMDPNGFSAWVFPKLFKSRLPKYKKIADEYGRSVSAADLHACEDEAAFLELIGE